MVNDVVTVIIDAIADLDLTVWDAQISITRVADAVGVCVFLDAVEHFGAVVTRITDAVLIFVELIGVRYIRAVIFGSAEPIAVCIDTRAAERAF